MTELVPEELTDDHSRHLYHHLANAGRNKVQNLCQRYKLETCDR